MKLGLFIKNGGLMTDLLRTYNNDMSINQAMDHYINMICNEHLHCTLESSDLDVYRGTDNDIGSVVEMRSKKSRDQYVAMIIVIVSGVYIGASSEMEFARGKSGEVLSGLTHFEDRTREIEVSKSYVFPYFDEDERHQYIWIANSIATDTGNDIIVVIVHAPGIEKKIKIGSKINQEINDNQGE